MSFVAELKRRKLAMNDSSHLSFFCLSFQRRLESSSLSLWRDEKHETMELSISRKKALKAWKGDWKWKWGQSHFPETVRSFEDAQVVRKMTLTPFPSQEQELGSSLRWNDEHEEFAA